MNYESQTESPDSRRTRFLSPYETQKAPEGAPCDG
jgi:hypothetical protein